MTKLGDSGLNRRTLMRGAAWVAPVVALSAPAPALAVSMPCTPPTISTSASSWTTSQNCVNGGAALGWDGTIFSMLRDASPFTPCTVTSSTTISLVAGQQYIFSAQVQTAPGYGADGCGTTPPTQSSSFDILLGTKTIWQGYTQDAQAAAAGVTPVQIEPIWDCPGSFENGGNPMSQWGDGTTVGQWYTLTSIPFTATTTGSITLTFKFTMEETQSGDNNDDWRVRLPVFSSCLK
ncbi:MAG: hypothetical protein V9E81_08140 [Marmoricola sp.]